MQPKDGENQIQRDLKSNGPWRSIIKWKWYTRDQDPEGSEGTSVLPEQVSQASMKLCYTTVGPLVHTYGVIGGRGSPMIGLWKRSHLSLTPGGLAWYVGMRWKWNKSALQPNSGYLRTVGRGKPPWWIDSDDALHHPLHVEKEVTKDKEIHGFKGSGSQLSWFVRVQEALALKRWHKEGWQRDLWTSLCEEAQVWDHLLLQEKVHHKHKITNKLKKVFADQYAKNPWKILPHVPRLSDICQLKILPSSGRRSNTGTSISRRTIHTPSPFHPKR